MSTMNKFKEIAQTWFDLSEKVGDKGSCVLGAGFHFKYDGVPYFMPAQSPWQGSISWETNKDVVEKMLTDAGATDIWYEWGNMD